MLVKENVTEDEMASYIADAARIYAHETYMAYPDQPHRSPERFALDYVAMLYSTTKTKEIEDK